MLLSQSRTRRPGMSLLEVLVALAIFLLALGGISQLMSMSSQNAFEVNIQNQAARLCQSKMAQVMSGEIPMSSQDDSPFDEDPDYTWSVSVDQGTVPNLWTVSVKVTRERPGNDPYESTLTQMVIDPSIQGSTQDITNIAGSNLTQGQQGTTGSTSGAGASGATGATGSGKTTTKGSTGGKTTTPSKSSTPAKSTTTNNKGSTPAKTGGTTPASGTGKGTTGTNTNTKGSATPNTAGGKGK